MLIVKNSIIKTNVKKISKYLKIVNGERLNFDRLSSSRVKYKKEVSWLG